MIRARALFADQGGASAVEFALVLTALIPLLFGIIDGGRFAYDYNQAEKATQMGARFAVVANPVAGALAGTNFVGVGVLTSGDIIPASAMGSIKCSKATTLTCACDPAGSACVGAGSPDTAAFTNIVNRMKAFKPDIAEANVEVVYSGSGLGFAGDPNGMDPSPLITVRLVNLPFRPIVLGQMFTVNLPAFSTTLTAEDLTGSQSN